MRIHTGEKHFQCQDCNYSFSSNFHLTEHMRIHTGEKPFRCQDCNYSSSVKSNLTRHKRTHSRDGQDSGLINQNGFLLQLGLQKQKDKVPTPINQDDVDDQVPTTMKQRPFQCSHCSSSFDTNGHLKSHLRVHSEERPFQCLECESAFKRNGHLKDHAKIHTGDILFQCQDCSSSFNTMSNLKKHRKIHTGEESFQ